MAAKRTDHNTPSLLDASELRTARVASVALLRPIDKIYSYHIPDELVECIAPGMRINVPFGRNDRPCPAFCLDVSEKPWNSTLKSVINTMDGRPLLNQKLLDLGQWIARYYASHLGRTLDLMIPSAAKRQAGWRKIRYATLVTEDSKDCDKDNADASPHRKRSTKQTAVVAALQASGGTMAVEECCRTALCTLAVIRSLEKNGVLTLQTHREPVMPKASDVPREEPDYELNTDQEAVTDRLFSAVAAREFSVQVVFGVTGSGKTECYVRAIRQVLDEGRQAILLVPEIALTTQTVRRLQARFDRVATIHSGLSEVERSRTWAAVASGDIPVVIGTRSAIFAPCPDLGIIIVDEEAEASYKNQAAPRFHTRDVAVKRAHVEGIPVVLGSATPSLETWNNVQNRKHYHLLRLPARVRGLAMPTVHLVDMRLESQTRRGMHLLSREMESHLTRTFDRGEQAVLLLNRRGYANFLHCPQCQTAITCPRCAVRMVFHASTGLAHCHYCQTKMAIPKRCQTVGCDGDLVRFGVGVERVENEIRTKFPQAKLRRVDSDIMQKTADYAEVLGAFERRECDILIGTQMIAKGLDFPFVSFVGVVSADTSLAINDFRSDERTFQLVLQVAGRSGRGTLPGHVVVQSFKADEPAIQHAVNQDYEAFAEAELEHRHINKLPPFTRLMRIILADPQNTKLEQAANDLSNRIEEALGKRGIRVLVSPPQASPISRLRDRYRHEIQLSFHNATALLRAVDLLKSEGTLKTNIKSMIVDVDPVSLQ